VATAFFVLLGFIFLMIQYLQVLAGQFSPPSASGPGSPNRNFELRCAYLSAAIGEAAIGASRTSPLCSGQALSGHFSRAGGQRAFFLSAAGNTAAASRLGRAGVGIRTGCAFGIGSQEDPRSHHGQEWRADIAQSDLG
jgi:hypothetical protein